MASRVMQAIRVTQFGGPEVLKLAADVPVPKPTENQVLIRVMAAGINPVDTYIRQGTYAVVPPLPYTPGMDSAGVVEAVGPGVTSVAPGDRVFTVRTLTGAYAEFAVAEEKFTFRLHDNLSLSQGACVGVPYFTAYRSIFLRAGAKPGQSILIHGASGAVGLAACQMSRAHGLTVLGTAGTPEGQCMVAQNGAHHTFSHREQGYAEKIMAATGGHGVDIILEMLANVNLNTDLELLAPGGTVVVIGSRGNVEINPRLTMGKETNIKGMSLLKAPESEWKILRPAIEAGMEQGWVKPVVSEEFTLADATKAHIQVIEHRGGSKGNIILSVASADSK